MHTAWIYEFKDGVRFIADEFCIYHAPGYCESVPLDFAYVISTEAVYVYRRDSLV